MFLPKIHFIFNRINFLIKNFMALFFIKTLFKMIYHMTKFNVRRGTKFKFKCKLKKHPVVNFASRKINGTLRH